METDYTKRELDEKFSSVHERFNQQDKSLEKILSQTTEHNHRLTKAEKRDAYMRGGLAVLTILVVPILLFIINYWISHK